MAMEFEFPEEMPEELKRAAREIIEQKIQQQKKEFARADEIFGVFIRFLEETNMPLTDCGQRVLFGFFNAIGAHLSHDAPEIETDFESVFEIMDAFLAAYGTIRDEVHSDWFEHVTKSPNRRKALAHFFLEEDVPSIDITKP